MAIGRGGTGLRSVRNLCVFQLADGMLMLVIAVAAVNIHGSVNTGVPVYYAGAFIALPLIITIAVIGLIVHVRSKKCSSKPEVAEKIGGLMKGYCVLLLFSWPGWFVAMMLTGITGICRNSGCSYSVNNVGNFAMAIVIIVCIGLAFFSNFLCTMLLYVYCSSMGLTMYGTRRIKVEDALSNTGSPRFTPVTVTTECQTLPASPATATAQCQTQPAIGVHESAFRPIKSEHSPRSANQDETSSPVWAIPSENVPQELKPEPKKRSGKKKNKKKRHKEGKYKHSDNTSKPDSSLPNLESSVVYSTSAVHLDSFGSVEQTITPTSPLNHRTYRQTPSSPPNIRSPIPSNHRAFRETLRSPSPVHSPDYLHVQLPNAPLSAIEVEQSVSYQVSYLPFTRTQHSSPPSNTLPIRIPTATPPSQLSPPPTPSFRTTAWQDSPNSSGSTSPVRCKTPQPPSSFSNSSSSQSVTGDPFLPTLQSRYNPTPPPVLSPRARGMVYTDAYEDDDSPPFTP